MSFKELLADKKIETVEKEDFDIFPAEKDILSAKHNFDSEDYDWAISIAYNAVLRAGRGLMHHQGYRPIGKEHHKNVFEFLRTAGFDKELVDYFDRIRKKRNKFIYGIIEESSKDNAKEVIKTAGTFVQKMRTFVQKMRT